MLLLHHLALRHQIASSVLKIMLTGMMIDSHNFLLRMTGHFNNLRLETIHQGH